MIGLKRERIDELLNPENDTETSFHIDAAIEHVQVKTNQDFTEYGELDLPSDLVKAVKILVESADNPTNVQSESVGGELSVSYFSADATESVIGYWKPYRRLRW